MNNELTKQDVQLLCDLVQDAMMLNESKFGPKDNSLGEHLSFVQNKLFDLMDWADV